MGSSVLRLKYSKLGKVRFLGHRDVARLWERVLRRAGLPLVYTQGFSPHPKLAFGLALPVGWESTAEYLDVWTSAEVSSDDLKAAVSAVLPEGMDVERVGRPILRSESLSELAEAADYLVAVVQGESPRGTSGSVSADPGANPGMAPDTTKVAQEPRPIVGELEPVEREPEQREREPGQSEQVRGSAEGEPRRVEGEPGQRRRSFVEAATRALQEPRLEVLRTKRGREVSEDAKPLVLEIREPDEPSAALFSRERDEWGAEIVWMRLKTKPFVLRPESVVAAVGGTGSYDVMRVRRVAQYWRDGSRLRDFDETIA